MAVSKKPRVRFVAYPSSLALKILLTKPARKTWKLANRHLKKRPLQHFLPIPCEPRNWRWPTDTPKFRPCGPFLPTPCEPREPLRRHTRAPSLMSSREPGKGRKARPCRSGQPDFFDKKMRGGTWGRKRVGPNFWRLHMLAFQRATFEG